MPRARRRRRRVGGSRRWTRLALEMLLVAVVAVVVIGSISRISSQSSSYHSSTDAGWGELAARVVADSNQTGSELASLIDHAPGLPNQQTPYVAMARTELQQGLDQAVVATAEQVQTARGLVPPDPTDDVSPDFVAVMTDRATAVVDLRTAIDQQLGMAPLPIAGAPASSSSATSTPLISIDQAARAMGSAGALFERADADYASLLGSIHRQRLPIHLPRSVWVPAPTATAPLSETSLTATATALGASAALAPYHQLLISALGLTPPAVATGGTGVVADSCGAPFSLVPPPGSQPTVLPPTSTVSTEITVTNCGTVTESGVAVTQTLALADPPGSPPVPAGASGGKRTASVTLRSGRSTAVTMAPVTVQPGHLYALSVSVAIPPGQADPTGSTQQLLVQITA